MGNFINTRYNETVTSMIDIAKDLLKNPYYLYTDKKACPVNYYHINKEKSTMDEAARIPYAELGTNCPFRFNKINGFFLYGLDKIQLSLENGDQGLESNEITGEAIVLPNTIIPYPGDYFEIEHLNDSTWLFRVNDVQKDTLDDGANIYKIGYKLEHTDNSSILDLVEPEDVYTMIVNNVGTEFNPIIRNSKYELLEVIDNITGELKRYFKELFYSSRLQTFIFTWIYGDKFYDPFMIEFLIRNDILDNQDQSEYVYVDHKLPLLNTFSIDYNKTFFRSFEQCDKKHLSTAITDSTASYISNIVSIFASRPEEYFQLNYKVYTYDTSSIPQLKAHNVIPCFPKDIVEAIEKNELFIDKKMLPYNIFIKYFNNKEIEESDLRNIENIDYNNGINIFYLAPLLIFTLETYAKRNLLN